MKKPVDRLGHPKKISIPNVLELHHTEVRSQNSEVRKEDKYVFYLSSDFWNLNSSTFYNP